MRSDKFYANLGKYYSIMGMKKLFLIAALTLFTNVSFSQVAGGELDKLAELYVMEDYEKCLTRAEKYMESDKTRGLSEPILYAALCWMKIYQDPELRDLEFYKNAPKNAAKLGAKFVKKDAKLKKKDLNYLYDRNIESIYELVELSCAQGKMQFAMDKWSKAMSFYKYAYQMLPTDDGVAIMYGLSMVNNGNVKEGIVIVNEHYENLKGNSKNPDWSVNRYTEETFHDALLYLTDYWVAQGEEQKAMECIQTARMLDPEYHKFKSKYKQVVG